MLIRLLESPLDGHSIYWKVIALTIMMVLFIALFYGINKLMKERNRFGVIALALSILSPGSGFAYSAAYIRAWLTVVLLSGTLLIAKMEDDEFYTNIYVVIFIVQAIWATIYANKAGGKLRLKKVKHTRKAIEAAYLTDLIPYIKSGHHLAVDTNFLMHFQPVLMELHHKTNVHLFLHPTVFGELEGLKKSKNREVRINAQLGFDILELYQKERRMQWTRRQKKGQNFSSPDQKIIAGVLTEIESGIKLVFVSHDKGARIIARSLHIPVVDPLQNPSKSKRSTLTS